MSVTVKTANAAKLNKNHVVPLINVKRESHVAVKTVNTYNVNKLNKKEELVVVWTAKKDVHVDVIVLKELQIVNVQVNVIV